MGGEDLLKPRREDEIRKARRQLLNSVSHELNTPLTPVLIHLRRLQDKADDLDPEVQEAHQVIARNVERLLKRVKGIIHVAQLDSERFPVQMEKIAFDPIVKETLDEFQAPAKVDGVRLEHTGNTQVNVHADPDRLHEVLANLLDNAIKFTPRGGTIHVITDDDTIFARVRVSDTGVGFDESEKHKLFKPFSHLKSDLPTTYQGAGLGLFISKGIIDLHGGEIHAESAGRGQGATFSAILHIAKSTTFLPGTTKDASKREVEFNVRINDLI